MTKALISKLLVNVKCSHLSLLITGTGQAAKEQGEECGEYFAQGFRGVCYDDLPYVQRGLSHHEGSV